MSSNPLLDIDFVIYRFDMIVDADGVWTFREYKVDCQLEKDPSSVRSDSANASHMARKPF